MKFFFNYFLLLIFLFSQGCSHKYDKAQIWSMMKSNNVDSIIEAASAIQEAKDTSMLDALIYNSDDDRITHILKYKGMSVYQVKMLSLKSITGIMPPKEITYEVDTTIINFYKQKLKLKSSF